MLKILIFIFCLSFGITCNAAIKEIPNIFDNSKNIYSISDKQPQKFPKYFILNKIIYANNQENEYYILIQNSNEVTNIFSNTEPIKIKVDNQKIFSFVPKISKLADLVGSKQLVLRINNNFINELIKSKNIVLQIPIYKERTSIISSYYYLEVPINILDEWKQVIAME